MKLKSTWARSKLPEKPSSDILAFTHQVALGDADIADDALAGGVTGAEGQFAGRLLHDLDVDDHAVRRAAWVGVDVDGFEKAESA